MKLFFAALGLAPFVTAALAQLPIPVPGQPQSQPQPAAGRGGRGPQANATPVRQVTAPIPTAVEVTGPGEFFETFMDDLEENDDIQDVYSNFDMSDELLSEAAS